MVQRLPFKGDIGQMAFTSWSLSFIAGWFTELHQAIKEETREEILQTIFKGMAAIYHNTYDDELSVMYMDQPKVIHFGLYLCSRTLNNVKPTVSDEHIQSVVALSDMLEKAICFGYQARSVHTNKGITAVGGG